MDRHGELRRGMVKDGSFLFVDWSEFELDSDKLFCLSMYISEMSDVSPVWPLGGSILRRFGGGTCCLAETKNKEETSKLKKVF